MIKISFLMLLLVVSLVAAQTKPKQTKQNRDEQNLMSMVRQVIYAQANFDAIRLERIYSADYVEISPIGEVDTREKAIGFYQPQANKGGEEMKMTTAADEFSVHTHGNFAVVISRVMFSQAGNETPSRPRSVLERLMFAGRKKERGKSVPFKLLQLDLVVRHKLMNEVKLLGISMNFLAF